jgi:hypothetical protein
MGCAPKAKDPARPPPVPQAQARAGSVHSPAPSGPRWARLAVMAASGAAGRRRPHGLARTRRKCRTCPKSLPVACKMRRGSGPRGCSGPPAARRAAKASAKPPAGLTATAAHTQSAHRCAAASRPRPRGRSTASRHAPASSAWTSAELALCPPRPTPAEAPTASAPRASSNPAPQAAHAAAPGPGAAAWPRWPGGRREAGEIPGLDRAHRLAAWTSKRPRWNSSSVTRDEASTRPGQRPGQQGHPQGHAPAGGAQGLGLGRGGQLRKMRQQHRGQGQAQHPAMPRGSRAPKPKADTAPSPNVRRWRCR